MWLQTSKKRGLFLLFMLKSSRISNEWATFPTRAYMVIRILKEQLCIQPTNSFVSVSLSVLGIY